MGCIELKLSNYFIFSIANMDDRDSTQSDVSTSVKRSHLSTGSTPAKPQRKRVKKLNSPSMRKPLFVVQANDHADEPSFLSPKRKVST